MSLKMDMKKYGTIFDNDGWFEAMKYKDLCIPTSLYKYFSLLDNGFCKYKKRNNDKLNSLRNNMIWVSSYKELNDPFEFKMITMDKDRIIKAGWDVNYVEQILDIFKDRTLLACFNSESSDNMPLWAHYANNHKGFRIKYSVTNPRNVFPILYEPKRSQCAVIPTMIINEMLKCYKKKATSPSDEFYRYFRYLYMSFLCKHEFWKYEDEYRLLWPTIDIVRGKNVPLSEVGLHVKAITSVA